MKKIDYAAFSKAVRVGSTTAMMAMVMFSFAGAATGADFSGISDSIVALINSLLTPALAIVGALGTLYCILLGVKFAKAEEPQEREKAKAHLRGAIIGFVLIFVLMVALKLGMNALTNWAQSNSADLKNVLGSTSKKAAETAKSAKQ